MELLFISNYFFDLAVYWGSYFLTLVLFLAVLALFAKHKVLALFCLVFLLFFVWARFIEPKLLTVNRADLSFNSQTKVKIALISDVHYGVYSNAPSLKRIVKKVNAEEPNLVLLLGDFVFQAKKEQVKGMFKELGSLQAPAFAVLGNHDVGLRGEIDVKTELKKELSQYVIVLDNQTTQINFQGRTINLIGLSDFLEGKTDFSLLMPLPESEFNLVLEHNPDAVYSFPFGAKIDLVVSGHTHAGQIRFPFLYKAFLPSKFGLEKGFYKINDIQTFITSGVGVAGLPFRFLAPPEIAILEI